MKHDNFNPEDDFAQLVARIYRLATRRRKIVCNGRMNKVHHGTQSSLEEIRDRLRRLPGMRVQLARRQSEALKPGREFEDWRWRDAGLSNKRLPHYLDDPTDIAPDYMPQNSRPRDQTHNDEIVPRNFENTRNDNFLFEDKTSKDHRSNGRYQLWNHLLPCSMEPTCHTGTFSFSISGCSSIIDRFLAATGLGEFGSVATQSSPGSANL